jgi:glycosyltransferase involved in cell wall biosynthesis
MLCYYYPPVRATGTNRSLTFSKHLRALGWDVTVLTVRDCKDPWVKSRGGEVPEGVKVERTSELNISRVIDPAHGILQKLLGKLGIQLSYNYFREWLIIPDTQIFWCKLPATLRLARSNDVLYASCSPFSSAVALAIAARFSGKPAVADFRDAWWLNPHSDHTRFHQLVIRQMEKFVLSSVTKLIVNTEGAARIYREAYPQHAGKIVAIPNGYDRLTPVKLARTDLPFRIMHVGNFYGLRKPDLLLQSISEMPDLQIEFVQIGGKVPEKERFAGKVKITETGSVEHARALELMQEANALYLKQGFEPDVKHDVAVAAKTYEYLATGLPVLAETPPGDNADVLREYGLNVKLVMSEDLNAMKAALRELYDSRVSLRPEIKDEFATTFDRGNLAKRLDAVLKSML